MKSKLHKVLHEAAGRPLLEHILRAVAPLKPQKIVVVVGFAGETVRERFRNAGLTFVTQDFSSGYGTGYALMEAEKALAGFSGNVMVLNGDGPLLRSETLRRLVAALEGSGMAIVTCDFSNPSGLGRIKRGADGELEAIVEEKDATPEERALQEVNPGVYLFDSSVFEKTKLLRNDNAAGEYYITDLPALYLAAGEAVRTVKIADETEVLGINDRRQLADAERVLQARIRERWLSAGVSMVQPETTFIDDMVTLERDVILEPGVILKGETRIGEGARVGAYSYLEDAVVEPDSRIAPHTVRISNA